MESRDLNVMGDWVRELRIRTRMTQRLLGERCGLTTQYVTLIETGRRCPSKSVLILMRQISDLINMPPPPSCTIAGPRTKNSDE